MAVYEISGQKFEVEDSVQGQDLEQTLMLLSEQVGTQEVDKGYDKGDELAQGFVGTLESGLSMATGAGSEVLAGLSGLAAMPFMGEDAADVVQQVRDTFTYKPKSIEGQRQQAFLAEKLEPLGRALAKAEEFSANTGYKIAGPMGAALASTLPTAALTALGAPLGGPGVAATSTAIAKKALKFKGEKAIQAAQGKLDAETARLAVEKDIEGLADVMKGNDPAEVAKAAEVNLETVLAYDELGIDAEPLAAFVSENSQFIDIHQAMAAAPGSPLDVKHQNVVKAVSDKADDLISQYGGTRDKAGLSDRFKADAQETVDMLYDRVDGIYDELDSKIDATRRIVPDNTIKLLDRKIKEVGGAENLPDVLNKINNNLRPKYEKGLDPLLKEQTSVADAPTLGYLIQERKRIGKAIGGKASDAFKDADTGLLKEIYRNLRLDNDAVIKEFNPELFAKTKAADQLVVKRKVLEDSLKNVLGKNLQKSLTSVAGRAVKQLTKGDTVAFDNLLLDLDKLDTHPQYKQQVVATALNDLFSGRGSQQKSFSPTQFAGFMDELDAQPSAKKRLLSALPDGAGGDLDNMAKIARGIRAAPQTKTGRVLMSLFDEEVGLLQKMTAFGAGAAATKATGTFAVASGVRDFLLRKRTRRDQVSDLLASDDFQKYITNAAKEGITSGSRVSKATLKLEKKIQNSKEYLSWLDKLPTQEAAQIATFGLAAYLLPEVRETEAYEEELEGAPYLDEDNTLTIPITRGRRQ